MSVLCSQFPIKNICLPTYVSFHNDKTLSHLISAHLVFQGEQSHFLTCDQTLIAVVQVCLTLHYF